MDLENWKNYVRQACNSFEASAKAEASGNENGARLHKKDERLYDKLIESEMRAQLKKDYIRDGAEIGMTEDQVFEYIALEARVCELAYRIGRGNWHIAVLEREPKDNNAKINRFSLAVKNFEFQKNTIQEIMQLMIENKGDAA